MAPKSSQRNPAPRSNRGAAVSLAYKRSQKTEAPKVGTLSPKDAAVAAATYFRAITGYHRAVTIEEIERTQGGRWRVTIGYQEEPESPLFIGGVRKAYKVIEIDGNTGEALSMKIREVG